MAEEWSNLVWAAIALIIFSVVLVIAFNFTQLGKSLTTEVYQEQADVAKTQEVRKFLSYDNVPLSGSEAFSAALQFSGDNYLVIVECRSAANGRIFMYSANNTLDQAISGLNLIASQDSSGSLTISSTINTVKNYLNSGTMPNYASDAATVSKFLELFNDVAKTVSGAPTFTELNFKSYVMVDNAGYPMGLYLKKV